jgi:hypothetical protein
MNIMFAPDKEYLVTFNLDGGELQSQQLNCWASDPSLSEESAKRRLAFQRGLGEEGINRIQVKGVMDP